MESQKETFSYSYSAGQQEEVKAIREKYLPKEENKLEQLCRLDAGATRPGSIAALAAGVLGALVFGIGMCCCLVWQAYISGCLIGILGIAGMLSAYPMYLKITKKQRAKLAPEIMRLTDELMK